MLRMKHTKNDLEPFFEERDDEFETLENIIRDALEIINAYEKQIESSEHK